MYFKRNELVLSVLFFLFFLVLCISSSTVCVAADSEPDLEPKSLGQRCGTLIAVIYALVQSDCAYSDAGDESLVVFCYPMSSDEPVLELLYPERQYIADYVAGVNPTVDASDVASIICMAADEQGLDPWLLTALARYESTFQINLRGKGGKDSSGIRGEHGLLQVHPCHERRFKDAGCRWGDPLDSTRFGAMMISTSLAAGRTLYRSLSPWAVRARALRAYAQMERATGTGRTGGSTNGATEKEAI